jgi:acyl transferase domain-containing protein
LALEKGVVPPTAGLKSPNAAFKLMDWKIALPDTAIPWPRGQLRRVSVNSFGYGGANSHLILEDAHGYMQQRRLLGNHSTSGNATADAEDVDSAFESALPTPEHSHDDLVKSDPPPGRFLFAFSGFDQAAVARILTSFAKFLGDHTERQYFDHKDDKASRRFMSDLAFTLAERRTVFTHRVAVSAASVTELTAKLHSLQGPKTKKISRKESVAFIFTGQGAQYCGMGRGLLTYPAFRESLERSQLVLAQHGCAWNLVEEIIQEEAASKLDRPEFAQPICTAIQIAQVDLLASWSVYPAAVVGHSSGEIAAGYASGNVSHTAAIVIAYYRGIFSAQVGARSQRGPGAMLAVGLGADQASAYLESQGVSCAEEPAVVIACINSPQSVTLSGDLDAIRSIEIKLKGDNIFARQLKTHHTAYHSLHMECVAGDYQASLSSMLPDPPRRSSVTMFSSVTGKPIASPGDLDARYWVDNMLRTVRFSEALQCMLHFSSSARKRRRVALNHSILLELGPSSSLKSPVSQNLEAFEPDLAATTAYASLLTRGGDDESSALAAAAQMWSSGTAINFAAINRRLYDACSPQVTCDLPAYPWNDCGKMWHESTAAQQHATQPRTDLLGYQTSWRHTNAPVWRNMLRISEIPWLGDHRIHTAIILPGASMIVSVLEAAQHLAKGGGPIQGYELRDITFSKALVIPPDGSKVEVQLQVWAHREGTRSRQSQWHEFSFASLNEQEQWNEHCHGYFQVVREGRGSEVDAGLQDALDWSEKTATYDRLRRQLHHHLSKRAFYGALSRAAMMYGPTFQAVESIYAGNGETHGLVTIPDTASVMPHGFEHAHLIHPTTLDAISQITFGVMLRPDGAESPGAHVPVSIGKLFVSASLPSGPGSEFRCYAKTLRKSGTETVCQIVVSDKDWSGPKVVFDDFAAVAVAQGVRGPGSGGPSRRKCAQLAWIRDIRHSRPLAHWPVRSETRPTSGISSQMSVVIRRTLAVLSSAADLPGHLQNLVRWATRERLGLDLAGQTLASTRIESHLDVLEGLPAQLETVLLRGEPLASAMTSDIWSAIMKDVIYSGGLSRIAMMDEWLDNARDYNPCLSILLLGDGTPYSIAAYVAMKHLSRSESPDGLQNCVFTERSGLLLDLTRACLDKGDTRSQFAVFDPAKLDSADGIGDQIFDIIIGPPALAQHATTLGRVRSMLSTNGTLLLNGLRNMSPAATFFLGLLEGQWSSADDIPHYGADLPSTEQEWKTLLNEAWLEQSGHSLISNESLSLSAMPSKPAHAERAEALAGRRVVLVESLGQTSRDSAIFQSLLLSRLTELGCSVTVSRFGDVTATAANIVICLAELSDDVIATMNESTFADLKALIESSSALIWVTRSAVQLDHRADGEGSLGRSITTGLFRSIRSEFSRSVHMHVDVSLATDITADTTVNLFLAGIVDEILPRTPDHDEEKHYHERELLLDGQDLLVPRVLWNTSFNRDLASHHRKLADTKEPLHQIDRALRLIVANPGHLDSLQWIDDERQPLQHILRPGECLIKAKAWALNFMVRYCC